MSSNALPPYPTYKPTAIPWLQQVPEHWSEMKVKYIFRERVQKGYPSEPLLAATQSMGVVTKETYGERTVTAQKDLHLLKLVETGDFVISLRSFQGGIEISHARGIISPAYTILKVSRKCHPHYLAYLLKSAPFIDGLKLFITGIREGQNIDYARLARTYLPWPEPAEQHLIVRYLHALDAKVKRYIRAKRSLIARLQEQKQAIIQRAVTRGLDPNVKLKPSGSIWLDEIPENWTGLPLKRWLATPITDGPHETPVLHDDGVPFMSAESMVNGRLDFNRKRGFISEEDHRTYCLKLRPRRDDIFMCKSGATTGKVAIVETDDEFSVWSPLALIRVDRTKVIPRLLFQLLQVPYVQRQVQMTWSAGTQPNLSMGAMARLFVALPGFSEQERILEFVKTETGPIDRTIERVHKEIDFMQEYHTRLIADVVTGAVDVRAAAQALPEDQMISGSDEQIIEVERLSMAAEGEEEYDG